MCRTFATKTRWVPFIADKGPERGWRRIQHGIHKSTLAGHEGMKIGVPQSQFYAKESVQQAVVRAVHGDASAILESFREHLIEVVAHFPCQASGRENRGRGN